MKPPVILLLSYGNKRLYFCHVSLRYTCVLSVRGAEKEWMAGRLPVKSLRVSTSSLACFCHKLLFGPDLICTALCRRSSNLQHQAGDACRFSSETLEVDVFYVSFSERRSWNRHVKSSLVPV